MNLLKKLFLLSLIFVVLMSNNSFAALKNEKAFKWKFKVANDCMYAYGSDCSGYSKYINHAMKKIDEISSAKISVRKISKTQYADVYYNKVNNPDATWYGRTYADKYGPQQIIINHGLIKKNKLSTTRKYELLLHELGHAFGMKHQKNSVKSVMKITSWGGYKDYTSLDKANIRWRY